jgi:protein-disulfide isomerase
MASKSSSSSNILAIIVVAALAFAGGFLVKNLTGGPSGDSDKQGSAAAPSAEGEAGDSSEIPIGESPIKGPKDAPVTIVEFSDFQCPFCSKGEDRLKKVRENYPDKVRVVFKHYPLPMHKQAHEASRAAMAAGEQGKFWEMHDKLFANQKKFAEGKMKELAAGWAKEIGLDVEKFKKDYTENKEQYLSKIDEDMSLGKELGVRGTPHFLINGEALSGAQPYSKFESVIDSKLEQANEMLEGGVAKSNLYAEAVKKNFESSGNKGNNKKPSPKKKKTKVENVPVSDDDAMYGATEDYLVTVVEFSDFECPFCDKALPAVNKIKENFSDQVRLVFKHRPLSFHKQAEGAAKAAIAAQMQGKFWEMHDKLFANQKKLGEDFYVKAAKDLGLNVEKFKKDMNSDKVAQQLKNDTKVAGNVGANGTPTFFINGVKVVGAQPYSRFESEIEKQIKLAKKIKEEKGVSGEKLYEAVVAKNKKDADSAAAGGGNKPSPSKDKPAPKVDTDKLTIGDSPVKGPEDAPVTVYEFSDFECPYCSKAKDTFEGVLKDYEGKVKVVHKNYPLPFHKAAKPAAHAALAAQEQGKFWEMYDLLFKNQKQLDQSTETYVGYAKELGLNVEKFKKDMKAAAESNTIKEDMAMGKEVGVRGTPAYFINGQRLVGAQPASKFKSAIDSALEDG